MSKFLDNNGLLYLWSKINARLSGLESYTLPAATEETLGGVKVGSGLSVSEGVLSAAVDWSNVRNKPELALKSDLASLYRYKGSVTNYASLPADGNDPGDVWNVEATGMNYAWTGESWDSLGQSFEVQIITNAEIDSITSEG